MTSKNFKKTPYHCKYIRNLKSITYTSVVAVVAKHAAVGSEDFALADESHIHSVAHYGQIPGAGIIEYLHHLVHAHALLDAGRRHRHKFAHEHLAV